MRMPRRLLFPSAIALAVALAAVVGCGGSGGDKPTTALSHDARGSLTVWDYYGSATPIKPAIAAFHKAYPNVHVNYQAYDYDTIAQKFPVAVSSGSPPDVATIDMTLLPTYAANGTLSDLSALSGGKVNGEPIGRVYPRSALDAMTFDGHYVSMLYDFDAYALYYRADLLARKHLPVPHSWSQLRSVARQLAEPPDRSRFQVLPDTFHFAQMLFQQSGRILTPDDRKAAFDDEAGVSALGMMKGFLDDHSGVYWGADQGDSSGIEGVKDGRIAMFENGPYVMGILKQSAPEQRGKWRVAPAPVGRQPGSYLGGTGLVIPANANHKEAAWAFTQFLLRPDQQIGVYKYAGAAPATAAALASPELTKPDPYFGGQAPFTVFRQAMNTATHFPYVKQWPDVDGAITDAVTAALLGKASPQKALSQAADKVDGILGG
jgi:multiple sugar transport system substrate-binding protein